MSNRKDYFVTGTDTEIGKTLVSCAILYGLVQHGWRSVGMKPVAAGAEWIDGVWRNEDVTALQAVSNVQADLKLVSPYLFKMAAAPHIAARQEQCQIEIEMILQSYHQLRSLAKAVVVEGVGGFRVPFSATEDSSDLAQQLALPVVLVVGMRLGCISAALLTAEAIRARGLQLAGWVANSAQTEMAQLQENISALRERLEAPYLGYIPHLNHPDPGTAFGYLDLSVLFN